MNKDLIEGNELEKLLNSNKKESVPKSILPVDSKSESRDLYSSLSDDEKAAVNELAEKLDYEDSEAVLNYGTIAQDKIGKFSHEVLDQVRNKDAGDIGETLGELMFQLSQSNPNELLGEKDSFFNKIFRRTKKTIHERTSKYENIGEQVDEIALSLKEQRIPLIEDNKTLSELYDQNLDYYKALNIYIAAGQIKLKELEEEVIPKALIEAEGSGDNQMLIQRVSDLTHHQNRLDKRVHELKVTRQITMQQAPQIRLIQNTNQELAEKIQSSINTTIPLWKNSLIISLALIRNQQALSSQQMVSEATNNMLRENSEMLKMSSIETAKETERSVVDIETLELTQSNLIETLEETLKIQTDGTKKRREAEARLEIMEDELKTQLLEIHQTN